MKQGLSLTAFGHATSIFFATAFALCVGFDLLFPAHAMFAVWQNLLPGFKFIDARSFLLGAVESYAYGWFIALIWVPLYNVFALRKPA
ncbi:MAG TPA: hypothetical protein VFR18_17945 [Terriglobia bacterium]|nr:hypothetical protein [Terriglobia bacterium]